MRSLRTFTANKKIVRADRMWKYLRTFLMNSTLTATHQLATNWRICWIAFFAIYSFRFNFGMVSNFIGESLVHTNLKYGIEIK